MRTIVVAFAIWTACGSTAARVQTAFVDDANRSVVVPARVSRVFAAGAPAEVMLYTLAPDLLVGRNRMPGSEALEFFPPAYRTPTPIRQLPEVDDPAADAELVALRPELYIDYGTIDADYVASVNAVQRRTGVPGIILNGALANIPDMYRRLGGVLGVPERGQQLASAAEGLLQKYRGVLGSSPPQARVYLGCSADGFVPCLEDDSAGEQLRWLGGINAAGTRATAPRRPLTIEEIEAMAPHVVVVTGSPSRLRSDPAWKRVDAVAAGRVYEWPALPYSWGARPPSVNRLPGLAWLAYVARGRSFDAELDAELRAFYRAFYHLELTDVQLRTLLAAS